MYRDDLIRGAQGAKDWTTEELAQKSGVHYHTVRDICKGKETVQVATLKKVADALDLPLAQLFEPRETTIAEASPALGEPNCCRAN